MISLRQHLLLKLAEECTEVAQRAMKSMQFGAEEVQKGQDKTNAERLRDEVTDLEAVIALLEGTNDISRIHSSDRFKGFLDKRAKIEKYLKYSQELGMVE